MKAAARALLAYAVLLFAGTCLFSALNGQREPDWGAGLPSLIFPVVPLAFAVVGSLVAARHPRNAVGWIALAVGIGGLGPVFPGGYEIYANVDHPGSLPFAHFSAWMAEWAWVAWVGPAGFLILLFPDGRLASPRWKKVAWLGGLAITLAFVAIAFMPGPLEFTKTVVNPFGIEGGEPVFKALAAGIVLIPIFILLAAVSLVGRYRRSTGESRLQLKWFTTAVALVAIIHLAATGSTYLYGLITIGSLFGVTTIPAGVLVFQGFAILTWILIPIAAGIAILKYRLYSIDLVINKALVFGVLAAFVTATYVGIVAVLGARLSSSSKPNLLLSIAATAVVAVAFQPIKERVQRWANRLVYGRRSTPYEVLARLSGELGMGYSAEEISQRVARALHDGTGAARAELWLDIEGDLRLQAAWPPESTAAGEADARVDVVHDGESLGALALYKKAGESLGEPDRELMRNLAAQVALVLRNARLTAELQARLTEISRQAEELRASRQRIVTAQDAERRRIERNLHDGAQQRLLTLSLSLRRAEQMLEGEATGEAKQILTRSAEELKGALAELRELARGIHPAILREEGLSAAVLSLSERAPLPVAVANKHVGRLPGTVEATAYFVVSEALTNVARYSSASRADVSLAVENGWLVVEVADDGTGGADPSRGSGLRGLMDRVSALGGELQVESAAGSGTVVGARIPCE